MRYDYYENLKGDLKDWLEEEKQFNINMANKLRNSFFSDPYYSAYGCDDNVRRINTILKLKKEINNESRAIFK